jgi:hypothetical protein
MVKAEQIHAAADALHRRGFRPTCRAVQRVLGAGSLSTIGKHLKTWRAAHVADGVAVGFLVKLIEDAGADPKLRLDAAKALLRRSGRAQVADDDAADAADEWGELLQQR